VSLPGADELFRTTGGRALQSSTPAEQRLRPVPDPAPAAPREVPADHGPAPGAPAAAAPAEPERVRPLPEQAAAPRRAPVPPPGPQPVAQPTPPTLAPGQQQPPQPPAAQPARRKSRPSRRPSGRERHDEKITVYVSAEELMDLEHARLVLRGEHGLAVDRGRIVREAVAVVLADLESRGDASILVRRLRGR
jgi:hypothetical protein